jgi:hypothetical protein
MDLTDHAHLNDPHRLEFEEYIYDNQRTAEELRHLILRQYDEIQALKSLIEANIPTKTSRPA